jgi:acetyltransferase-like isoleucine patch superfamily enzyme
MRKFPSLSKIISRLFAIGRGQLLVFPKINYGLVKVYGKVNIRGTRRNITFGDNVTFLGEAILICGNEYENDSIYIGNDVTFENGCYINAHGGSIQISDRVFLGVSTIIQGKGGIFIGSDSMLGPNVQLYSSDHQYRNNNILFSRQIELEESITIGNNVWIGANSILLKGSSIHSNSVVAACSLIKLKTDKPALISKNGAFATIKREMSI